MEKFNMIQTVIEPIFKDMEAKYENIMIEDDDDINYIVEFKAFGRFEFLDTVEVIVYFQKDNYIMNFLVPNIYTCEKDKEQTDIYELVNDINAQILCGAFLVRNSEEEGKYIIYKNSFNCGEEYRCINKQIIIEQLEAFFEGIGKLFEKLKKVNK